MIEQWLKKAQREKRKVQIVYLDEQGRWTKRWVSILRMTEEAIVAYCDLRKAPRTFHISKIFAVSLDKDSSFPENKSMLY
jgi:predicted DNA-binding transcriptional regulator YafY